MATKQAQLSPLLLSITGLLIVGWVFLIQPPTVNEITPQEVHALPGGHPLILDVREPGQFEKSHILGAIIVPIGSLENRLHEFAKSKTERVVVYCNDGSTRGPNATRIMNDNGFAKAVNLKGGLQGWQSAGLPVVK